LQKAEAVRLFDEARAAWREAQSLRPKRFLLRVERSFPDIEEAFLVRDGERYWNLTGREIRAFDGRFHRRFADPGWPHFVLMPIDRRAAGEATANAEEDDPVRLSRTDEFEIDEQPTPVELPVAPFALPTELGSYWTRFEQELLREEPRLAVEQLGENRFLFEVACLNDEETDGEGARATRWTLVARRDLDWCVEACDVVESYSQEDGLLSTLADDPFVEAAAPEEPAKTASNRPESRSFVEYERAIRSRTLLGQGGGLAFPKQIEFGFFDGKKGELSEQRSAWVRFALELDPKIDERLFDRPTLDSPPPVLPGEKSVFAWYVVAMLIGVAAFAVDPLRAAAKRLRRAEPKKATTAGDESGKDAA
jgi:hypothetical protein